MSEQSTTRSTASIASGAAVRLGWLFVVLCPTCLVAGGAPPAAKNAVPKKAAKITPQKAARVAEAPGSVAIPERLPIPDAESLARAEKSIREAFATEYAAVEAQKTPLAKGDPKSLAVAAPDRRKAALLLAHRLMHEARATTDDTAARYAQLLEAVRLAAFARNLSKAIEAIDSLAALYLVDGGELAVKAVHTALQSGRISSAPFDPLPSVSSLIDDAIECEQYDLAAKLNATVREFLRELRIPDAAIDLPHRAGEVSAIITSHRAALSAAEVLRKNPNDPAANAALGRFRGVIRGEWQAALPLLKKSDDKEFALLAERDLAEPTSVEYRIRLGDDYWAVARTISGHGSLHVQQRACDWYALALPGIDGLTGAKLEKRIEVTKAASGASDLRVPSFLARRREKRQLQLELGASVSVEFTLIPPGEFIMGSTDEEVATLTKGTTEKAWIERFSSEAPRHSVKITRPFYLGIHEVTVAQFRRFVDSTRYATLGQRTGRGEGLEKGDWVLASGYSWRNMGLASVSENDPVVNVTWHDAVAFCDWLSKRDGARYRLPTEAEWEYACRAGATTRWSSGDDEKSLERSAWLATNSKDRFHPVMTLAPNALGLYDMNGNAWEWVADWYSPDAYRVSVIENPGGPSNGSQKLLRGGAFNMSPPYLRSACRLRYVPNYLTRASGFRVARELE